MRWINVSVLLVLILGTALAVHGGSLPRPQEIVELLANAPELRTHFTDPQHGRFDAAVFLFTCMLGLPFVVLGAGIVLALSHVALEATVLPVGRLFGCSDAAMVAGVTLAAATIAYMRSDLWVPGSLHVLGMVARAWVVSMT